MRLALRMAHDDEPENRISGIKILKELKAEEPVLSSFIIPELKNIAMDELGFIRLMVPGFLADIAGKVSKDVFSKHVF